ncbi:hypothetical protein J1614_006171 [Plenodomus biglobosus]|nr:hypothetical protein J1614_006171 [Plenodomus biglobosus]
MAQIWFSRLKRFFERRGRFRGRLASSPTLTSLDHPDRYMHGVGQQPYVSFLANDYDIPQLCTQQRDQNLTLNPANPYAQAPKSPPPAPVSLEHPQQQDQHEDQNEGIIRPCQPLLPHTSASYSGLPYPILQLQPPRIRITAPSTSTSPQPPSISPIASPTLPTPPSPQTQNPQLQARNPTPTKPPTGPPTLPRQRYHPTRPAPRPPTRSRLSLLKPHSHRTPPHIIPEDLNPSPIPPASHWTRISRRTRRDTESSWRDSTVSAMEEGVGAGGRMGYGVREGKGGLCISRPVPGSFEHVDGAFLRGEGRAGWEW